MSDRAIPPAGDASVCAIIVTCNPPRDVFAELLAAVRPQVDEVIIVDNASREEFRALLREESFERTRLLPLSENLGVGAAHNIGIREASRNGHSHVLLLDHDSIPEATMVARLLDGLQQLSTCYKVAAVGPSYCDPRTNAAGRFIRFRSSHPPESPNDAGIEVDFLITSGTLIPVRVLDEIGPLDAGLFVDYVDTEWCLRAAAQGCRLFGIPEARMRHTIGDDVSRAAGVSIPDYSPRRLYYLARNQLLLAAKHRTRGASKVRTLLRTLRLFLYYGLLTGPRLRNLASIARGLVDGLRRREGRCDLSNQPKAWRELLEREREAAEAKKPGTLSDAA